MLDQQTSERASLALSEFDYDLPKDRIAQIPLADRDQSKLLLVDRPAATLSHKTFKDIPKLLRPDDVLVVNRTRVNARRLFGARIDHPAERIETFVTHRISDGVWLALVRPGKKALPGSVIKYSDSLFGRVMERTDDRGGRTIVFSRVNSGPQLGTVTESEIDSHIFAHGAVPLPPYIETQLHAEDDERYQTVYGDLPGSAAAPTAGLHFTESLLDEIEQLGVRIARVTLHIGLGTFRPIEAQTITDHKIHSEHVTVDQDAVEIVNGCCGRVVAVGTTSARALESAAIRDGVIAPYMGETSLYITPGYRSRVIDTLITNFHMPRTTLFVMVSALAGTNLIRHAYNEAITERYRFLSFGDAMLIDGIKAG